MATYAIGDVQGCHASLERLLERIDFDPAADRLWFCGDLVNRGPRSAEALRWVHAHRDACTVVLGNHDLHLLARAHGLAEAKRRDTLDEILQDPGLGAALEWLASRPFVHAQSVSTTRGRRRFVLVHAGLLPRWSVDEALTWSERSHRKLVGRRRSAFLRRIARCRHLTPGKRVRSTRSAAWAAQLLTNLRACDKNGRAALRFHGPPQELPQNLHPWHAFDERRSGDDVYVCGHWAAQGLVVEDHLLALDSGCVWGGRLSAVRLEDRALFQVDCADSVLDG